MSRRVIAVVSGMHPTLVMVNIGLVVLAVNVPCVSQFWSRWLCWKTDFRRRRRGGIRDGDGAVAAVNDLPELAWYQSNQHNTHVEVCRHHSIVVRRRWWNLRRHPRTEVKSASWGCRCAGAHAWGKWLLLANTQACKEQQREDRQPHGGTSVTRMAWECCLEQRWTCKQRGRVEWNCRGSR